MSDSLSNEKTLVSLLTDRLRNEIISKSIPTGSHITIRGISEKYDVSNMPVREAFRILEGEGLLEFNAYKGAMIQQIDRSFAQDSYGVTRAMELLMSETVVDEISNSRIDELIKLNKKISTLQDTKEGRIAYIDLNNEFHNNMYLCTTNKKAFKIYDYNRALIRALRSNYIPSFERIKTVSEQHQQIIEALKIRDIVLLKEAVDLHLISAMENFLDQYYGSQIWCPCPQCQKGESFIMNISNITK